MKPRTAGIPPEYAHVRWLLSAVIITGYNNHQNGNCSRRHGLIKYDIMLLLNYNDELIYGCRKYYDFATLAFLSARACVHSSNR